MNEKGDFMNELNDVKTEMEDIGNILALVNESKKPRPAPRSSTTAPPEQPVAERPKTTKPLRAAIQKEAAEPVPWQNVTTRLTRKTNELLSEATLHQRLKKTTPATRQEIIEAALQDWFKRHGYLGAKALPRASADDDIATENQTE